MLILSIIIAVMAVIIIVLVSFLLLLNRKREVKVYFRDMDTNVLVSGDIYVYENKEIAKINMNEKNPVIKFKKGDQSIRIESSNYFTKEATINPNTNPIVIQLEKEMHELTPLPLIGCTAWGGLYLTDGEKSNELIINSNGKINDAAGFFHTGLNVLKRKTLVLFVSNTSESDFLEKRLVKIEYSNGVVVYPTNGIMVERDYLIAEDTLTDTGTEYIIPRDFAGRLNFVFYKADLKNLKIVAYFR